MKNFILIFLMSFSTFLGYSQLNENFEGSPPTADAATGVWALPNSGNWLVKDNRTGSNPNWRTNVAPHLANSGTNAAYVDRENTGAGVLAEEWLITPLQTVTANSQFRFFTKQTFSGDRQTKYQIRVSSSPDQGDLSSFSTILAEYSETGLSTETLTQLDYEEKIINLTFTGARYFAFVKVFTQPGDQTDGDRWLIDDVRLVERCADPIGPNIDPATLTSTGVTLTWESALTQFQIEYGLSGYTQGVNPVYTSTPFTSTTTPKRKYALPNQPGELPLIPNTAYQYYVRAMCADNNSEWIGPFNVTTPPRGSRCSDPIPVTTPLPFQDNSNTLIYGNNISAASPGATGCGTTGAFLGGNDVVYSYTPTATGFITISMNPLGATNTGVFVYASCAAIGNSCIAGVGNATAAIRNIPSISVTQNVPIYIVLSSTTATANYPYTLIIQEANCVPPLLSSLAVNSFTTTTANLTWANGATSTATAWQVAVQPLGALVPSGPGLPTTQQNNFQVSATVDGAPLQQATDYQYWVRSDCGNGLFSPWSGPMPFHTSVCEEVNKCNYTFVMTDTGNNNGWQNGTMQVKQAGILVQTIGSTITGNGPVNVDVALCNGIPFELYWNAGGANPGQIRVAIKNSFGQTIYAMTTASATLVGTTLFSEAVDCLTPKCQPPTNVQVPTATIHTNDATVTWTTSGNPTTSWGIFWAEVGQPAPDVNSPNLIVVPGSTTPPLSMLIPGLDPDTQYNIYVRSICSVNSPSTWTLATTFTTIPTCYRPTSLVVTATGPNAVTTTTANLTWVKGKPADAAWEILLLPAIQGPNGPEAPAAPADTPVVPAGGFLFTPINAPSPFSATGLAPATIYYYYIRTVCSGTDSSNWAGPTIFNTVTCATADKCNYRFILNSTAGNTWNNGRMQVRQNGIVVATLGAGQINNAAGVNVAICPGVPFDLFWSVPGTTPEAIGVTIVNPFLDVLYTKIPGEGTPLTVLYNAVGSCTAAPCAKPTLMTATTTATSATLSWTDNSTIPGSQFAIYVVPTGQPAPTNNPPTPPTVSPVGIGYVLTSIGAQALTPSTSYTYYVKTLCDGGDTSSWTVLSPATFVTKPANDECLAAVSITVNPGQTCIPANTKPGNTFGATASLPILTPPLTGAGCGAANNDIWYSFVAQATSQTINITDLVSTPTAATLNHSVFSGACDNLTKLYCSTALYSTATGLTVGNTYFIRVYNSNTTANQFVTFNICVTSPPANDECIAAADVPVNTNQVCTLSTPGSTLGASPSLPTITTPAACTTADDDVWFKFTATNDIHIISLTDIVGIPTTVTLNHAVLSGACGSLVNMYCSTATQSVATGLTIGSTYYIRVYTAGTIVAGQFATFKVCVKTPPPPATNNECSTALSVDVNLSSSCTLVTPGNIIGATASIPAPAPVCIGNPNDDVWFTFVANSATHFISLLNVEGTTTDLNHAVYSGTCGALTQKYCSAAGSLISNSNTFVIGQRYYIRVWSNSAASQVATFNVCVKSISSCSNAQPFCGSSTDDPFIFENTTGITSTGNIACLTTTPNPTYYTLHVGQTGPLQFSIVQNTSFDANGNPSGVGLDVDYVAWGPFTSPQSCQQISLTECPTCPDNTDNPNFYPFGNIVDCSWDPATVETLSIPNAIQDQYYVILITNFDGDPGLIKLVQTNFGDSGAGETICCSVGLGPDKSVCDPTVTLNALEDVEDINNVPATFQWFFNGSTTPIAGQTGPTLLVSQSGLGSGTYKVSGNCGLNPVSDIIQVTFNITPTPVIETVVAPTCAAPTATIKVTAPTATGGVFPSNIYISEVTDEASGTSSPSLSYVEIYNGTGATVDLSNYKIKVYTNGVASPQCSEFLTGSGSMANNTTKIIKLSTDANQGGIIPHLIPGCTGVNTDDSIVLTTSTDVVIDTWGINGTNFTPLGQPGYDYIRSSTAVAPSATFNAADWIVTDWTATNQNYTTIGSHVAALVPGYQYNIDGGAWVPTTTFPNVTPGVHTVNVKDVVTGCTSSLQFTVTQPVTNPPVTTFTYTTPICKNSTDTYTPNTSIPNFTSGGKYTSSDPAGLVVDINTGQIDLANSTPGSYDIIYTVLQNLANCLSDGETRFPVVILPVLAPNFPPIPDLCVGGNMPALLAQSPNGINGTWSPNVITQSGNYVFTPNLGQCSEPQTLIITVLPLQTPDFAPIPTICSGGIVPVLNPTSPNGIPGTWTPAVIDPLVSGTYKFTPSVQCGVEQELEVTISSNPDFRIVGGCQNGDYVLTVTSTTNFQSATYIWKDNLGNVIGGNQPTIILTQPGTYSCEVIYQGCSATEPFVTATISCLIQKGISPKGTGIGDNKNDYFDLEGFNVSKLEIFNRYGTKVYSKSPYVKEWFGQSDGGDELPDGTYFYVIERDGQDSKTGWIYINHEQ